MEVVQGAINPDDYRGTCAVIIDKCQQLVASLGMVTIQHYLREANRAAHALSHYGATQGAGEFWFVDPHVFLIPVLVDDHIII